MTGGGILGVSPNALRQLSGSLSTLADELAGDLRSIDDEVSGLVGTDWTGQSSKAYAESFWEWFDGAKEVHAGLREMVTLLNAAAGDYEGQDHSSAAALGAQMQING